MTTTHTNCTHKATAQARRVCRDMNRLLKAAEGFDLTVMHIGADIIPDIPQFVITSPDEGTSMIVTGSFLRGTMIVEVIPRGGLSKRTLVRANNDIAAMLWLKSMSAS